MKKVFVTLFCLAITGAAVHAQNNPANPQPTAPPPQHVAPPPPPVPVEVDKDAGKFKFEEETHDFGEVPEGPLAEFDFEFKNTGKKPIVIQDAHGSCGCTVPTWPHDPILPKHSSKIHVAYTTMNRPGMISKEVTITSNAQQNPIVLHIRGTVKAKPVEAPKPTPTPPPPAAGK